MSPEQTIEKMRKMRLSAMADAYRRQLADPALYREIGFDDRLAMMVDHEADVRASNKINRLVNGSGMYFKTACPEDIRYEPGRGFDREQLSRILDCSYIAKGQNVVLEGASSAGKTWLSCSFGVAACRCGYKVRYFKMRSLIDELMVARAALDGSYQKLIGQLRKTHLVIVDDFLLHEVSAEDMGELLELVDARLLTGSTILCSQYQHEGWIKIMGRTPISEAFMSRIESSSHILRVKSVEDLRMKNRDTLIRSDLELRQ